MHSLPGALLTVLDLEVAGTTELTESVLVALDSVLQSATSSATLEQLRARDLDVQMGPWVGVVVQWVASVQRADDFGAVAFTHDPARGAAGVAGEFALGQPISQVVSGRQRPEPMTRAASRPGREGTCLEVAYPDAFQRVRDLCVRLSERADEPLLVVGRDDD